MKSIVKLSWMFLLVGLVISCKSKGDKAETTAAGEVAVATGKSYTVDAGASQVMWEGSKIAGTHSGTVAVKSGSVSMDAGKISAGNFVLDLTSIANTDLPDAKKGDLEGHLKSADFFDVANHPTATFALTKATKLMNDANANYIITGNLTMKAITKQVQFKAMVDSANDMLKITTPKFTIDRTDWDVKYGSNKFFEGLKDKAINDKMGITISLTAK